MPKKIPSFYWASDANCNELRVLRTRANKLNSGSRKIRNFCDSFKSKTKHFKNNKKGKFGPIEDFHVFLSSETILSEQIKNRTRLRPLLNSNRDQTAATLKNIVSINSLKKKHPNRMAVDFDHMYIDCGDSKISIGRDLEFQHLKELNLLHLELIQQQSDEIKAKDKVIKSLQEENKNLRARLDRIDRRISLNFQKKNDFSSPITVQTDFPGSSYAFNLNSETSPRVSEPKSQFHLSPQSRRHSDRTHIRILEEETLNSGDTPNSKRDSLRKSHKQLNSQLSPVSIVSKFSPLDKRPKKDSPHSTLETLHHIANHVSLNTFSIEHNRKLRSPNFKRNLCEETVFQKKVKTSDLEEIEKSKPPEPDDEIEEITDHSLRSRHKSSSEQEKNEPTLSPSNYKFIQKPFLEKPVASNSRALESDRWPLRSKIISEIQPKVRGEGVLTTSSSYYLLNNNTFSDLDSSNEDLTQVEIPQWRIKSLASLYVMEGTENLEDEIFNKRHGKPEYEERRRKRWDMQRMREQRQIEKLRERYECKNSDSNGADGSGHCSLWPHPESAQHVQIDTSLPVCAFGQNLSVIQESDFSVPWIEYKTATPSTASSTRRKKK